MSSKTATAAKEVIENADEAMEAVEQVAIETLETLERIPKLNLNGTTKKQQLIILGFTALTSAGIGGFLAYKAAQKRLRSHYEDIAADEINSAKAFYAGSKSGVFSDPVSARDALIPEGERRLVIRDDRLSEAAVSEYSAGVLPQSEKDRLLSQESLRVPYHEMYNGDISLEQADAIIEKDPEADTQEVIRRIKMPKTPADADNFDMEVEAPLRGLETPYVITHDEFFDGDRGFENQDATWYSGDSVLVDSADEPIGDVESMVGANNMSRFGHGSKDEHIVYIRNERFEIDFEIALSEGTYTKDVLGLDP